MTVLLPNDIFGENDEMVVIDSSSRSTGPVKVLVKPFDDSTDDNLYNFVKPFYIVRTKKVKIQPKTFTFAFNIGVTNILPLQITQKFSNLAHLRWEKQKQITDLIRHVSIGSQTNISGIITKNQDEGWKLKAPKPVSTTFVWSLLENSFTKKRTYNEIVYDLSQIIYFSSPKTYNLMRQFIPLPSFQKLYLRFGDEISNEKVFLEDLQYIDIIINQYKERNRIDMSDKQENIHSVTLAIDAFAFKSFQTRALTSFTNSTQINELKTFNNGFLFMMIPSDFRFPSLILHIEKESNGNYNINIERIANYIKIALISNGFNVWFKATDGDRYLSQDHIIFYNKYISGKSGDFLILVNNIFTNLMNDITLTIPIGDPLHLLKSLRNRYQLHPIVLFDDCLISTNFKETASILDIGKALLDDTHLGKMRDIYVIKFFTLENVIKLLKAHHYVDAVFIFPLACWLISFYSLKIDLSFRLFFLELSFQMISLIHLNFTGLKENKVYQRAQNSTDCVTMHEEQYMIRILNTLVATALSLIFSSDFVRTDGCGTHLVENQIGIARDNSNDPRWKRILAAFSHAILRKKLANKHGLTLYVPGRINDGGVKIDEQNAS